MTDNQRIPTTERHAELRDELARVLKREVWTVKIAGLSDAEANHLADAVLPFIEQARKQGWHEAAASYNEEVIPIERADARELVVEGLVATIKALESEPHGETHLHRLAIGRVLAVVEAARAS